MTLLLDPTTLRAGFRRGVGQHNAVLRGPRGGIVWGCDHADHRTVGAAYRCAVAELAARKSKAAATARR